ncbi:NAD(P)H-dependent oxidoreductase [Jeotgalibacillus sp. R-1-5s-1]|uniref:NAD(P)H-dependent oxidoreductase n=1 Tax=Jeotgalibacillus sp. R-1-5s-1 TaxID=2555897 RepID=UPI00106CCA40|nr:NAD(P)H-dependent oxidoreductase [Jeotgalibacillus sp. R-1-5s-1]TFD99551.1 flavodoxin family protein [Jeotgalibacillus sp. R-1-5s-1]
MNLLIIYTYPNHESLSYAFLQEVLNGSSHNDKITETVVLDLYAEKFNPALMFNAQKRRRDMHLDPDLEKYREQILRADKLVFIYPIWWGRPPAMLLGYIDQLFASNFAYRDKKGYFPEGLLKGKSVVCISTMKGPAFYPLIWLNNAHKVLMKRALFSFVGIKKVKFFEFGNMESPGGRQKKKLKRVYLYFNGLKK